ncbi:protein PHYLLO, chloroplastic isoform X3 [Phragmites australis]|uniref:protein PHYLLO, chloroplastic isoform X3 n=1 Tax=Phragmites australis TaxID=29695 RepID=UPI002D794B31|nr:protein PHYLLO, chloroplastic isoform X3 [Phragmites australis]
MLAFSPPSRLPLLPSLRPRPPLLPPRRRCLHRKSHPSFLRLRGCLLPPRRLRVDAARRAGIVIDVDEVSEIGDRDLPVDVSFTRRIPPALTVGDGLDALRRAVDEVKASPPGAGSGVIRFEVLVPPSTKALKWWCSQFSRSSLFPQFYLLRKLNSGPSFQLEICGIGSAICLHGSKLVNSGFDLVSRYLSSDSHLIRAYGSVGMKYDKKLLSIEEKIGSYYFFIPQVELSEFGGCSILSSTMVWDDYFSHTFEDAVSLFESCFDQIQNTYDSSASISHKGLVASYISGDSQLLETGNAQLVYLDAEVLATIDAKASVQKEKFLTSDQSFVRFSPQFFFCSNMDSCLQHNETESFIKSCPNINLAWASLIVEECVRLGFTYFCIAPGSRSSPLALSATSHPLTTCISCYDERSLGFHALGYGRGSRKPAVVITSSGTAVSNLLPSVVEASQDFIPIILLTADRPPELHAAGANQAINQVNHFGTFVRYFFNLPPPGDQIYARMVLTTLDSAAYYAMQTPQGPVHINCAFREPLEYSNQDWNVDCLRGLDKWFKNSEPYTRYLRIKKVSGFGNYSCSVMEVLEIIEKAEQGLLLVGALHTEDDLWAVTLLARHLSWPVAVDILSGLRLRKVANSFPGLDKSILFIDHIDQILLSDSAKNWISPDVVVQIGSRITSKRVGMFLESCFPSSYILIDRHPCRHDPSHVVTHRIQASVAEFAASLCQRTFQRKTSRWKDILMVLNSVVSQEIMFQIHSKCSLTEPYVAHVIGESLYGDAIMFVGNSMVIRDLDMFGKGWLDYTTNGNNVMLRHFPDFLGTIVAGNRGASGIDGLLSTAIGFAVGSNKHVFCVVGDISFLHDTNGLALLNQRARRKPMTIIVINNHGGAIFSLLPIAKTTSPQILKKFFYTSHDISIPKLCAAHRIINMFSNNSTTRYLDYLLGVPYSKSELDGMPVNRIQAVEYMLYRIQLSAPRTSGISAGSFFHEGFILKLCVDDSIVGFGEVAPIEIHEEDMLDVEEQLRFLFHRMKDSALDVIPMLGGSFSNWIWTSLGIPPSSIFPSVKCGLEMAILNLLVSQRKCRLSEILAGSNPLVREGTVVEYNQNSSASIQICALVDSNGTPMEVALAVAKLVAEGFNTVKLKVGRRESPTEDAAVLHKIREIVGYQINIRVDANQKWTYEQAVEFGYRAKSLRLQYIEEPVSSVNDLIKFCEKSGLPVALDETIDNLKGDVIPKLHQFVHPGIVALVIKPSVVGGFENAAHIAKWAQMHDKMAVISSAYESSVGLASYIQLAHYVDLQNSIVSRIKNKDTCGAASHGLGTYQWLREDVSEQKLKFHVTPLGGGIGASVEDAHGYLHHLNINNKKIVRAYSEEKLRSYSIQVDVDDCSYLVKLQEAGDHTNEKVVLLLHGFLGTSEDWVPMMKALSPSVRVIAVDLPGHGESQMLQHHVGNSKQFPVTVQSVADLLLKLMCHITDGEVVVVGYSMGARIALHMAVNQIHKISGAVIVSGSPGLRDEANRRRCIAIDKSRAQFLLSNGLECFLETWYSGKMWASLREHPKFDSLVRARRKHENIKALANVLEESSVGRQRPLWEDLKHLKRPLLIVAGEKDKKFKEISQQMCREIRNYSEFGSDGGNGNDLCELIIIPDSGHAVHVENPLPLVRAVRKFVLELH